jgi:hypothetical protein
MRVVHCKREAYTHYIGRPSALGNPYAVKTSRHPVTAVQSSDSAIRLFEQYARDHLLDEIRKLPESAVLGCWCKPKPCHGDVIVRLWLEMKGQVPVVDFAKKLKKNIPATGNDLMTILKPETEVIVHDRQPLKYADLPLISLFPAPQFTLARDLLQELEGIRDTEKAVKDRKDEILAELEKLQRNSQSVIGEPLRGFRYGQLAFAAEEMPGRETLNREALLMAGVSVEQLKAGMKRGKGFVQRNFKVLGEAEEKADG